MSRTAENSDAAKIPIFAWLSRSGWSKARFAMNNETVNPMPASAPTPMGGAQVSPSGSAAIRRRTASHAPPGHPDHLADNETDDDNRDRR